MAAEKFQITKRKAVAVVAATAVFAIVSASAATLGGVNAEAFGADQGEVTSPVTGGVSLSWETVYSGQMGTYVLDGIALAATESNEDIPADAEVKVTVLGEGGAEFIEYVSTDGGQTWKSDPAATVIPVGAVDSAAVVINGGTVAVSSN